MKQNELAAAIGLTQTYLSQIENNQKQPSQKVVEQIGKALNVPAPIIFFLALEENDLSAEKRMAFNAVSPLVKALVDSPPIPQTNGSN